METEEPFDESLFDKAGDAIEAAAEGTKSLAEAREAFFEIAGFRPRGMENLGVEDTPDQAYESAANTFKMALDALESDEPQLAKSYIRVARIKVEKARTL